LKAILDQDKIVRITEDGDIEIGTMPKNVGIERLRFDGEKVVDLADLNEFWVVPINSGFDLHCIEVPNSQLVEMNYADRKYLRLNNSVIRLKTPEEVSAEGMQVATDSAKSRLRAKLKENIGDIHDQHFNSLALICALIVYARQQPQALSFFFDDIIPDIKDIFPLNRLEGILKQAAKDLKTSMEEYWQNLDDIGE
jgi:hypothetical protein